MMKHKYPNCDKFCAGCPRVLACPQVQAATGYKHSEDRRVRIAKERESQKRQEAKDG